MSKEHPGDASFLLNRRQFISLAAGYVAYKVVERIGAAEIYAQPDSVVLGFSPMNNSSSYMPEMDEMLGYHHGVENYYVTWGDEYDLKSEKMIMNAVSRGIVPMITSGPGPTEGHDGFDLSRIKEYEPYLRDTARMYKRTGVPILFRLFSEMNINDPNLPYGRYFNKPWQFKAAWRYVRQIFWEEGADNVLFVFNVNATFDGKDIEEYYPGDDYVDINSLSVYDRYSPETMDLDEIQSVNDVGDYIKKHLPLPPEAVYNRCLEQFNDLGSNKPVIFSEFNSQRQEGRDIWIEDAIRKAMKQGVKLFIFFDWNKSARNSPNAQRNLHLKRWEKDWGLLAAPKVLNRLQGVLKNQAFYRRKGLGLPETRNVVMTLFRGYPMPKRFVQYLVNSGYYPEAYPIPT